MVDYVPFHAFFNRQKNLFEFHLKEKEQMA